MEELTWEPAKKVKVNTCVNVVCSISIMILSSLFIANPLFAEQKTKYVTMEAVSSLEQGRSYHDRGDFQQAVMDDVGISASLIGAVYAVKRLLSIAVQGSVHHLMRLFTSGQLVLVCALLMLAHFFGMGLIENPWWLLGPLVVGSLAWVGLEIAVNDYINQATQTSSRATLLSMNNFVRNFVGVLTIGLYGLVTQHTTAAYGYLVLGIVCTVVLIVPVVQLFCDKKVDIKLNVK